MRADLWSYVQFSGRLVRLASCTLGMSLLRNSLISIFAEFGKLYIWKFACTCAHSHVRSSYAKTFCSFRNVNVAPFHAVFTTHTLSNQIDYCTSCAKQYCVLYLLVIKSLLSCNTTPIDPPPCSVPSSTSTPCSLSCSSSSAHLPTSTPHFLDPWTAIEVVPLASSGSLHGSARGCRHTSVWLVVLWL